MRTFKLVVVLGALAGASGCGGGLGPEEASEPATTGPLMEPCMSAPAPEPVSQAGGSSVICHIPPGNPENAHTLTVGAAAVSAHLGHGDSLGACGSPPPPPPGTRLDRRAMRRAGLLLRPRLH
jgi:hypothetical protein